MAPFPLHLPQPLATIFNPGIPRSAEVTGDILAGLALCKEAGVLHVPIFLLSERGNRGVETNGNNDGRWAVDQKHNFMFVYTKFFTHPNMSSKLIIIVDRMGDDEVEEELGVDSIDHDVHIHRLLHHEQRFGNHGCTGHECSKENGHESAEETEHSRKDRKWQGQSNRVQVTEAYGD